MTREDVRIRRRPDGSIDTGYYVGKGHVVRSRTALDGTRRLLGLPDRDRRGR